MPNLDEILNPNEALVTDASNKSSVDDDREETTHIEEENSHDAATKPATSATDDTDDQAGGSTDGQANSSAEANDTTTPDVFPRSYVEKLRKSEASYREKAKRADELEKRLHAALVAKDGRLADPGDLEFNPEHLDDEEALAAAISELITRKPGLKAQQLRGDVGAGNREAPKKPQTDLLSIIRGL